jgi:hypothetical protein
VTASLILVGLAIGFAYLAYDSYRLRPSDEPLSASAIAKGLGQDISHLSAAERQQFEDLHRRFGVGKLSQTFWLFVILAGGCALGAVTVWFRYAL